MRLGWEIVQGAFEEKQFPDQKIFGLFCESLPEGLIINNLQLAKAFSKFCQENRWHPQCETLLKSYEKIFTFLGNFEHDYKQSSIISSWKRGVKEALNRLKDKFEIRVIQRPLLPVEKARSRKVNERTLYAFNSTLVDASHIIQNESLNYLGYADSFGIN